MSRCATCTHWVPYSERFPGNRCSEEMNAGGLCESPKLAEAESWERDQYVPDALAYPYREGGHFWTGPEFGCVHHTPKEPHMPIEHTPSGPRLHFDQIVIEKAPGGGVQASFQWKGKTYATIPILGSTTGLLDAESITLTGITGTTYVHYS